MAIVTELKLVEVAPSAGQITTIGHVFRQGDIPAGHTLTGALDGAAVPLQLDVKATWDDGSVKHAVLSMQNPAAGGSGILTLENVAAAPQPAPLDVATIAAEQEYSFQIDIDGTVLNVTDLLGDGSPWLSGALASEVRVEKTLGDGLDVRVDVRAMLDGTIETSVIVGNDNVETTDANAKTYSVTLTQNGQTVYQNAELTQPHFTVWRESYSTAADPNTAHAIYDLDYLRKTGLMPSVDDTIPLDDGMAHYDRLIHDDATYDPMELGGINNYGGIDDDRGRTGGTPSYGLITDDQHSYLVTQSPEARQAMLALTDQYGIYSNYYRNPETGEAYFLEDTTSNSYSTGFNKDIPGTDGIVELRNDSLAQRNSFSHKPSEYYLPYLVTGDRYYADGLAHEGGSSLQLWANAVYLTADGHVDFASQLREQTWVLRDLFYSASLAPDGTHAADVLTARLDAALQDYVDYYVNNDPTLLNEWGTTLSGERGGAWFIGGDLEGALQSYNSSGVDRPYWQDWFAMVVGQIALTGNENAITLGRWMAGFGAERFLQDDFDPDHNLYSILDYPYSGNSKNLTSDATWERLNNAATSVGGVDGDSDHWAEQTFYAGSAWGGAASAFSGTRDARYAEALLWMTTKLTDEYVDAVFMTGNVPQFGVPVTFADYTIAGVQERVLGTELADEIIDGGGNRIINAGDGDDIIETGAGSHLVEGGEGDDSITGGNGEDWIFGGSGADVIAGGAGINYLQGDRHDVDFGRFADRFVFDGTLGTTTVGDFDPGSDTLVFDDVTTIDSANVALAQFVDTADGATLDLGTGNTLVLSGIEVSDLTATDIEIVPEFDTIQIGTAVDDMLIGDSGKNHILGLAGDDVIRGAEASDTLDGGDGRDWVSYVGSSAGVTVDLNADGDGMQSAHGGDAQDDIIEAFENVIASAHADTLLGNDERNVLVGGAGDDVISGHGGNDAIRGGSGSDVLDGGDGLDWVKYVGSGEGVVIDLNLHAMTGHQSASGGDAEGDTLSGFERINASEHDDHLTGDDQANHLIGRAGDDIILGNAGNDRVRGGEGADSLDGGDGVDWVQYIKSAQGVAVDLNAGADGWQSAEGGNAEGDMITGFERVVGSNHDDTLTGNDEKNHLLGRNGNDVISGDDGDDVIRGGSGADMLDGGDGSDWVQFLNSDAGVIIDLNADSVTGLQSASGGSAEGDLLSGFERVNASEHDDILIGDEFRNHLFGRDGADTLNGGQGNDVLRGGSGADTFLFTVDDGKDVVLGFEKGVDLIRFSGIEFADLSFTEAGNNVIISYGLADTINLRDVGAVAFTESDFDFV